MNFFELLDQQYKQALKTKDAIRLSALRLLKTAIRHKETEVRRKLEEKEALVVVMSQVKQRRDSMEQFKNGGRDDLAQREEAELAVLEAYLPRQLNQTELEAAISGLISELEAKSVKDMGRVMKEFMGRYAGQVDGKLAGELVKKQLSGA
ncbi:MAG: GatB/YqeY domain-containing protein [Thermodesulfobacteriota bacterium]